MASNPTVLKETALRAAPKGSGRQGGQASSREEGGLQKTQASLEAGKASVREKRQVKPRTARAQESGCFRHGQNRRVTGLAGPDSTLTSTGGGKCGCRAALGWAGWKGGDGHRGLPGSKRLAGGASFPPPPHGQSLSAPETRPCAQPRPPWVFSDPWRVSVGAGVPGQPRCWMRRKPTADSGPGKSQGAPGRQTWR